MQQWLITANAVEKRIPTTFMYIYITIIIGLQSTRVCKMVKMCNYEPD